MASTNPRILPAPSRPMDSSAPGSPADPYSQQPASSKRKTDLIAPVPSVKKRARVSYSCQECHRRKQKCDRQVPCGHCVARKVPELCKNYQPGKTEDFNARLSRLEQIIDMAFPQYATGELTMPPSPREHSSFSGGLPGLGDPSQWNGNMVNMHTIGQLGHHMDLEPRQDGEAPKSPSSRSESPKPEGGHDPAGGMLESGRWYGTSALGSVNSRPIIEQLQHSTPGNVQPIVEDSSEVTDKLKSLIQDCGVPPHKLSELVQDLPPRSLSDVLIDFYFTSVNYTRYPLYEPSFRASYESICTNGVRVHPNDIRFLPLLFVVLAVSARLAPEHILGDDRQKRLTSLRYYWSSRRSLLIASAVQTDSFELILTRLLSVRFLTFDRRITECWAQLGAAVRTAQALGLHRDPAKLGLDAFQTEYRRRVWAYLYHADATFALLLGRPRTIYDSYCDTLQPLNIDDEEILEQYRNLPPQALASLPQSLPAPLQGHPMSQPTHTTFSILRHSLATIIGHIVHHFQLVRHHTHYSEVLSLDAELQRFVKDLPPHYALDPDTSLDTKYEFIPVHRFLIVTEAFFVRISLHRPYLLRRLDSERFTPSRKACVESAKQDFEFRQTFKRTMPQSVIDSLGGAYREFQAAMISGIALVIDPHGPDAPAMHKILDTFLLEHGVGEGAHPMLKELDETTKRELKIIEFLSQKAKSAESQPPRRISKKSESNDDDDDDETEDRPRSGGEQISAERSSVRSKRKKPSRSGASAQEASLLLGISNGSNMPSPLNTAVASNSSVPSPFMPSHSRTPSNVAVPRPILTGSPLPRTPVDSPSPKFPPGPNLSPSFVRANPPSHVASPRLIDLAQRHSALESMSMASSSPSAEDESAQKLLDNWCNNVTGLDNQNLNLRNLDPNYYNMFGGGGLPAGGPMWSSSLMGGGALPSVGLGLMTSATTGPGPSAQQDVNGTPAVSTSGVSSLPSAELGPLGGDSGADYMYWDALVSQIRGGMS